MALANVTKEWLAGMSGPPSPGGDRLKIMFGSFDFDSSYPTGGETLDLSNEFANLKAVQLLPNAGYVFEYDLANKKVLAYWADNDATADSALIQVANTTDLSGVTTVFFIAYGY